MKNENEPIANEEPVIEVTETPPPLPDETSKSEPVAETAGEKSAGMTAGEVARLVAEAERRGWLRARNEMAAKAMNGPALLENPCLNSHRTPGDNAVNKDDDFVSRFLSTLPRNVWE